MELLVACAVVYAVWCVVKHTPDAATKELTRKSADATQRVVLWSIAAVILISVLKSLGGV